MRRLGVVGVSAVLALALAAGCRREEQRQPEVGAAGEQEGQVSGGAGTQEPQRPGAGQAQANTVEGQVRSVGEDEVVIVVPAQGNRQLSLQTDERSQLRRNGETITVIELEQGAQVRASYVTEGGQYVLRELTVVPQGGQQRPPGQQ